MIETILVFLGYWTAITNPPRVSHPPKPSAAYRVICDVYLNQVEKMQSRPIRSRDGDVERSYIHAAEIANYECLSMTYEDIFSRMRESLRR